MPFVLLRNPDGSYKVKNKDTGSVKAKKTTKTKAEAQIRLLELIRRKEKK
jgi:hypothetical protein